MHNHSMSQWQHDHDFSVDSGKAEKNAARVMLLTASMMVVEIVSGTVFGSMALLADGWHMATHVAAFGITIFAYRYAARHAKNDRYTFGTGKVNVLGGFASAVALAVVALVMALESTMRMFEPATIQFNEAIGVAVIGLIVNIVSGLLLHDHHHHGHDHGGHDHGGEHHHDHNLRAAYFHVLADALTSLFAIVALTSGKFLGWVWLDPVMGLVGACVITWWAWGLMRDTSQILLDGNVSEETKAVIRDAIEKEADNRVADLHVWHLGANHLSVTLSVVTHDPREPDHYKQFLKDIPGISHVLVEVICCSDD